MKRSFTSKQQRRQAEDAIIRNMRIIQDGLNEQRKTESEPVYKEGVMTVLTKFIQLKKASKDYH